jgi:predicted transcriptional regulator
MTEDELAHQIYLYYMEKCKSCAVIQLAEFCGKSESTIYKVLRGLNGFAPKGAEYAHSYGRTKYFVPARWYMRDVILKLRACEHDI